jgi:acrylyl-CoA reductase (NADPH)
MENFNPVFKALLVSETVVNDKPVYQAEIVERKVSELPAGDLLIRVKYSSLNYKDALSAHGNKGVTRQFPHTPGIDAAGVVVESSDSAFKTGDEVIVIGYDLGMNTSGGFAEYIRVPAGWAVVRPDGLSLRESMVIGTAGFTAALCVEKLLQNQLQPEQGPVLVTGATGGVGIFAVALLAQLGFEVVACTGKASEEARLRQLGAASVINRAELSEASARPLLKEQWAGAVDVAGGELLANIIKSLKYGGSVACCGLVASPQFSATVLPFILRGVNLLGVDSVNLPLQKKQQIWTQLAGAWKLKDLQTRSSETGFDQLNDHLSRLYRGESVGRVVLAL